MMGYAGSMDKSESWYATCPHRTCPRTRFASPIRREGHLVLRHDADAPAVTSPGPLVDIGTCTDKLCDCGGPT
jgi:hypothetical protein